MKPVSFSLCPQPCTKIRLAYSKKYKNSCSTNCNSSHFFRYFIMHFISHSLLPNFRDGWLSRVLLKFRGQFSSSTTSTSWDRNLHGRVRATDPPRIQTSNGELTFQNDVRFLCHRNFRNCQIFSTHYSIHDFSTTTTHTYQSYGSSSMASFFTFCSSPMFKFYHARRGSHMDIASSPEQCADLQQFSPLRQIFRSDYRTRNPSLESPHGHRLLSIHHPGS
jgi:hypothetical protein